jgi:small conductance mechanosensitive channel
MTERIKKTLDSAGISIPFPQRDVHIYKTEN